MDWLEEPTRVSAALCGCFGVFLGGVWVFGDVLGCVGSVGVGDVGLGSVGCEQGACVQVQKRACIL